MIKSGARGGWDEPQKGLSHHPALWDRALA